MVEKVGVQTQTCSQDPYNLSLRRVALGPNLYFRADGTVDQDPLHYWGYGFNFKGQSLFVFILPKSHRKLTDIMKYLPTDVIALYIIYI